MRSSGPNKQLFIIAKDRSFREARRSCHNEILKFLAG
jgi:hypothetical protein